jgi:hypothetical protein
MTEVPITNSLSAEPNGFVLLKSEELPKTESKSQSSETNKMEKTFQVSTVQSIEPHPVIQMISKEAEYMFVLSDSRIKKFVHQVTFFREYLRTSKQNFLKSPFESNFLDFETTTCFRTLCLVLYTYSLMFLKNELLIV